MRICMLHKKHLSKTTILKKHFTGKIKKKKLSEIPLKMPDTKEELLERIILCNDLAEYSYSKIPFVLEATKDTELDSNQLYFISTLRRNNYQGHKLKDTYLLEALSKGYATIESHFIKGDKLYSVFNFEGHHFVVRVEPFFLHKYPVKTLDEIAKRTQEELESLFTDQEDYLQKTNIIRQWYVRWHDAMKKTNLKIQAHNDIHDTLMPMLKAGQVKLVDTF